MPQDHSKAFKTHHEAAESGDPDAQFRLGVMFGLGLGVGQDYAAAVHWYKAAAQADHPPSQCNLGWMYGTGRGVPQDYVRAYAWYSIAAAGGEETARKNRDIVASKMTPPQLEEAQRLSGKIFDEIGSGA